MLDGVTAWVNQDLVTMGDVARFVGPSYAELRQSYRGQELDEKLAEAYKEALDSIVERKLAVSAYGRIKDKVPDDVIRKRVDLIIRERSGGDRMGLLGALQQEGVTLEEWRAQVRDRLVASFMRSRLAERKGIVSPQAVREVYRQNAGDYRVPLKVKMRMIVLGSGDDGAEAARKRAEELRARLAAGADFAAAARDASKDSKAANGGDWGWVRPDETLRKELAAAVRALRPGQISQPVEIQGDFYIVRVEDRQEESTISMQEASVEIEKMLGKKEDAALFGAWIRRMKQEAYVRVLDVGEEK